MVLYAELQDLIDGGKYIAQHESRAAPAVRWRVSRRYGRG